MEIFNLDWIVDENGKIFQVSKLILNNKSQNTQEFFIQTFLFKFPDQSLNFNFFNFANLNSTVFEWQVFPCGNLTENFKHIHKCLNISDTSFFIFIFISSTQSWNEKFQISEFHVNLQEKYLKFFVKLFFIPVFLHKSFSLTNTDDFFLVFLLFEGDERISLF